MRSVLLAVALALGACSQPTPVSEGRERSAANEPAGRTPRIDEIFGQWQVAELNGTRPREIHVLVGHRFAEAVSQCVPFTFRVPGQLESAPMRAVVEPVCARTLSPDEAAFGRAAAAVRGAELLADGRLLLGGKDGRMVLARPTAPVLNPFQNAPGPDSQLMWGAWRVAAVNGHRPSTAMQLAFFRSRVELSSGCVSFGSAMAQEGATLRLTPDATGGTSCERMLSPEETAAERILAGTVTIAESRPTRRLLRGATGTILLER